MNWELYLQFVFALLWELRIWLLAGFLLYFIILVVLPWLEKKGTRSITAFKSFFKNLLMTDVHTKEQRSYNMSMIKGKWTKQERKIHNYLKARGIKHEMHPKIEGKPDILIKDPKAFVFLDGCFWHKCPRCFKEPETNREFWLTKIEKNVRNDKEITKKLKGDGWKILRLWEHEIRENFLGCLEKIVLLSNK